MLDDLSDELRDAEVTRFAVAAAPAA